MLEKLILTLMQSFEATTKFNIYHHYDSYYQLSMTMTILEE